MGKLKNYDYLIGQKINDWTVISISPDRNIYISKKTKKKLFRVMVNVECLCSFTTSVVLRDLITGKSKRCRKCHAVKISGTHLPHLRGSENGRWKGVGEIPAAMVGRMVSSAKTRGHEITITPEYLNELWIKQGRRCALSGLPLIMPPSKVASIPLIDRPRLASIDRIDSSKGYVLGNVQWICKVYNLMKRDLDEPLFFEYIGKLKNEDKSIQ